MSAGLLTRIGLWLDNKFESKATEGQLKEINQRFNERMLVVEMSISKIDFQDIKTRIEKIELYAGMTRKVDPTK